ncbi:serine acetyltransferase [Desulfosarcina ovata subsp. sediminis]|uniref:Serine acetyltransferase n=1 Tax=Desulfosarcina ovata subsp. sediminis TaxID=885957 RepID=A0A5K7ZKJ4_9BACT|nr:serine O-acetyltransferase EpsC [Desulfosarcina ovata]BBO81894.1 serine acetyltransferase [Desulfosarcina ovata subsp. sediminis]
MKTHDESESQPMHDICRSENECRIQARDRLSTVAERIIDHAESSPCYTHIDSEPIPAEGFATDIIDMFRELLFPGYFSREKLDTVNLRYSLGQTVSKLYDLLADLITHNIRHDCLRFNQSCSGCEDQGHDIALALMDAIPDIRQVLAQDVRAAFEGDPAAKSHDEIIFSYPGVYAISVHRVAHRLFELGVPMLPRIMSEHAHSITGIDIHPGATIGGRFVIDHGTGVVIGETTRIGNNVRIYQGVTLGALSLPKDAGERLRGKKRHPTIEDDVIVYSGATILGGDTVIGARSVVGGNVWLTESIPPDTTVMLETPRLIIKEARRQAG